MSFIESWRRALVATSLGAITVLSATPSATAAPPSPAPHATTTTTLGLVPGVSAPKGSVVESWALSPAANTRLAGGDRPNLSYEVAAGAQIQDAVTLYNLSNVQLTFQLYATDAHNTEDGGFDLLPRTTKPADVGTWVTLPQANITLRARTEATLPITINVPDTATPGDHVGGILAAAPAVGLGPDGKTILIDRRTGPRVYLRVAGPLTPRLTVEKLTVTYHPALNPFSGAADVTYRVANRGNVRLQGSQQDSVAGIFGLLSRKKPTRYLPEILPGQSIPMHVRFSGVAAMFLDFGKVRLNPQAIAGTSVSAASSWRALTLALPFTILVLLVSAWLIMRARRAYLRRNRPAPPAPLGA